MCIDYCSFVTNDLSNVFIHGYILCTERCLHYLILAITSINCSTFIVICITVMFLMYCMLKLLSKYEITIHLLLHNYVCIVWMFHHRYVALFAIGHTFSCGLWHWCCVDVCVSLVKEGRFLPSSFPIHTFRRVTDCAGAVCLSI